MDSEQKQEDKKEHWSRHPAFLILLPLIVTNVGGIVAAIKYATVSNIPLFISIWLVGAVLSFAAGVCLPIYFVYACFSREARREGYIKFVLSAWVNTPKMIRDMVIDYRADRER